MLAKSPDSPHKLLLTEPEGGWRLVIVCVILGVLFAALGVYLILIAAWELS